MSGQPAMVVIEMNGVGGPEVLVPGTRPRPELGTGEVLIKVEAAGVNRPDVLQRRGQYAPPPGASDLIGLEVAGTIAALGPGANRFGMGEPVCALVPGGGYAEYVKVPEPQVLPIPIGLTMIEAAALPETFFTVWTNVFDRGALKGGEVLLVHGATSGIGTTAILLGKAFGATVIATARNADKCAAAERLGADRAIDTAREDFVAAVKGYTGGRGADVILDMVGGAFVARNYEAAAECGRIVQIAYLDGARATVDLSRLMTKRLIHTGSTLRPRTIAEKGAIASTLHSKVWPLIRPGGLMPVIDRTFPLTEAAAAHAWLEEGTHLGNIILTIGERSESPSSHP